MDIVNNNFNNNNSNNNIKITNSKKFNNSSFLSISKSKNNSNNNSCIYLPKNFYEVEINHLIYLIAEMLEKLTKYNDQITLTKENLTRFHSRKAPEISIYDYLKRIVKYAAIDKVALLSLLIYIDRICKRHRLFTISSLTVHRFIITSLTCASKAMCDSICTNAHYSKVGGIHIKELNLLELEFLFLIDWHLSCTDVSELQQYYINLVRQSSIYHIMPDPEKDDIDTKTKNLENNNNITSNQLNNNNMDIYNSYNSKGLHDVD
ncbi:cyclin-domain-containing protein [Anaeromyces robustus]|uniref:Cyclin-domain-containing protein n=1 Tax=Anaeromyces robustus TaxID=1754192 RepID=A0A1Y1X4F4_9FUNG|nr:cyclin-domain-containing protein [Anaeromyces robustus]|eukprot:ORX80689.1 cyclin-domain-containing protein [Anaeromyces robustus]